MNKVFALICYYLGLWGILGFFATLILGFLFCCVKAPEIIYFISLGLFALTGIIASLYCVSRDCKVK